MSDLVIFAFGSLIFSPEAPELCTQRIPARLNGFERAMNKRSRARACATSASFDVFEEPHAMFQRDGFNDSLAMGTRVSSQGWIDGVLLVYPGGHRDHVLALTDTREGFDPTRPPLLNGYLRARVSAVRHDTGERVSAELYATNETPGCAFYVPDEVTELMRARVLINATPRVAPKPGERVRGLFYLESVRRELRSMQIVDPVLEQLAQSVRSLPGPWCDWIA